MTCAETRTRLSAGLDGELSGWTHWRVERHLQGCSACRSFRGELETVDSQILVLADATPAPEYLTPAVMHRLPAMPPAWSGARGLLPWSATFALVGVQVAALIAAWWWGFSSGDQTAPVQPVSSSLASSGTARGSARHVPESAVPVALAEVADDLPVRVAAPDSASLPDRFGATSGLLPIRLNHWVTAPERASLTPAHPDSQPRSGEIRTVRPSAGDLARRALNEGLARPLRWEGAR